MDSFEINKIVAAILMVALLVIGIGKLSDLIFHVEKPKIPGYAVEVDQVASTSSSTVEAAEEKIDIAALMAMGDIAHGEKVFKKCAACHSIVKGGKNNKNKISLYEDAKKAVMRADVIFSDKVISMNDKVNKIKKLNHFKKFKIDKTLMDFAKKDCIFLHCLPRGKEVDEKVFLSKQSKVWQQALNRVHVQKSILLYCFGKLR